MALIIAFFNESGGVGKTTLTMNVGYHLAQLGRRVLVIDMDPQGSLTVFMGFETNQVKNTIYDAIVDEKTVPVLHDIHGMDLVPANKDLKGADRILANEIAREFRLKNALSPLLKQYDFILIDCPPSAGFLSISSLVAATHVVVPIETAFKARKGTEELIDTIQRVWKHANPELKFAGVAPTMYSAQKKQDKRSLESIQQSFEQATIFSAIPEATDVENASEARVPVAVYSPKNMAVEPLQKLAEQLNKL